MGAGGSVTTSIESFGIWSPSGVVYISHLTPAEDKRDYCVLLLSELLVKGYAVDKTPTLIAAKSMNNESES